MAKSKIISPVLLEFNGVRYKLLYLSFSKDGSIYIFFPRKKGYEVRAQKNVSLPFTGESNISLDNTTGQFKSPYLSFHPIKRTVHVNTQDKIFFKVDAEVLNMSADKNILSFPMCQIIFPNSTKYLDLYISNKKYYTPFIITSNSLNQNVCISLEVWIHPVGTYLEIKDLPLHSIRVKKTKIVGAARFSNINLKTYTCTIVICEIPTSVTEKREPGIIVAALNKKQPYIFELSAIY